jgi:hypothetical protein
MLRRIGYNAFRSGLLALRRAMLYKLGRFLQVVGLIVSLLGVSGNLARPDEITVKHSLMIAGVGIGIFYLGRAIQSWGGSPGP